MLRTPAKIGRAGRCVLYIMYAYIYNIMGKIIFFFEFFLDIPCEYENIFVILYPKQ